MSAPDVSVVIPASREVRLTFALEALAAQTLDPARFEVVVVADGRWSGPEPQAPEPLRMRFVQLDGRSNIAAARNRGWREARGALVAFTDDDCRPTPEWLEALLGAADGDRAIVQGRTLPDPEERHLLYGIARSQEISELSPWHETCNMLYPRSRIEALGGFDERFAQLGEDADLGLRAIAAGGEMRYESEALVYHAVNSPTVVNAIRQALRRDTIPLLVARHPTQRSHLWGGIFWRRSHALLLLAAGGLVLARRHRVAALAALPYLDHHTDRRFLRAGPRWMARHTISLAAQALVDSAEIVATAAGAVRARTPVL